MQPMGQWLIYIVRGNERGGIWNRKSTGRKSERCITWKDAVDVCSLSFDQTANMKYIYK